MPRTALAAVAAATLVALLGFASVASADPGDLGYKGPTFKGYSGNSGVPPSVSKPESKLWFNDGLWWAVMFETGSKTFHIFKLDTGTQTWTDTGTLVDGNGTVADALWDGSKLYIASHVYFEDGSATGSPSELYRYSYNAATDTYTLDAGFPVQINNTSSETLVIDKDSTGQLWATWTEVIAGQQYVMVNSTTGGDTTWGTPFQLSTNPLDAVAPLDDISSLVRFGGRIGVMWSDQSDKNMYFAFHNDADSDAIWSAPEIALGGATCPVIGGNCADDHINLKSDGSRVFAAIKTNLTGPSTTNFLLVRSAAGAWARHAYGIATESHTRAIVVLDTSNGLARMFSTVTESGGTIYEKTLPLSQADMDGANFAAGLGSARITDADQLKMNNATSTKQSVSQATGLVVLATNKKTNVTPQIEDYWHYYDSLGAVDSIPPALQTASITGSTITLTYNEVLDTGSSPAATAYAVTVGGLARTVSTVTVSGVTVVLRLAAPVIAGDVVTLAYTKPATGPVQDVAGNDAVGLANQAVTNSTSTAMAYDLVPTNDGTRSAITTNSGGTTNLFAAVDESIALTDNDVTYLHNNATSTGGQDGFVFLQLTDTPSNFTAMTGVTIDLRARTIARTDDNTAVLAQLFKADEVTPLSAEIQVTLNPGTANWVTISNVAFTGVVAGTKADWDGARVKLRWDATVVNTPDSGNRIRVTTAELDANYGTGPVDTTPPAFQSAAVNGSALTMTYNETLDSASVPATSAFAVTVNGAARGVSTVGIAGAAVTLTLASPVVAGNTVTVGYTKPATGPIQDAAGNDAVNLAATNVTNNTGSGGGTTANLKPNGDSTRDAAIKTQSGATTSLFAAIDDGIATPDDATTYLRNDNGQSGRYFAQLTDTPSNFGSMTSLRVDGRVRTTGRVDDNITLYAQLVKADGVTALSSEVAVGGANPGTSGWTTIANVDLTGLVAGTKADWDGAQLQLRWANVVGNLTPDGIQLKLTAVELHATFSTGGGGNDVTPPVFQSASVNGGSLTMAYNETLDGVSKPATSAFAVMVNGAARGVSTVGIAGSTVTLTLASPVVAGNTVTVAYTKPGTNPLQDVAGNDAANLTNAAVTNNTPLPGGTPPVFQSAAVNGSALTMTYNEALNPNSVPANVDFAISGGHTVTNRSVTGSTVVLTISPAAVNGEVITLSYTKGTSPIEDLAGTDAVNLVNRAVTNNTPPPGGGSLTLRANGDGAITPAGTIAPSGTVTLFDAIDEPVATSDDGTTYVRNNNKTSGSYFAQLTDTPAAFALMQSLTIDVRARTTGAVDDQTTLFAQVFQANGVTPLTNEVSVATNPGPGGFVTISGVTLTGLAGGSKAIWDGAQLRLRWAYTAVGTQDTTQIRVSAVELDGTF